MVTIDARAGKWLALALLLSVGANMFMGGLLAGRFASRAAEPPPGAGAGPGAGGAAPDQPLVALVRRMAAGLPDDERASFEQAFIERRRDIVRANVAVREARLALRSAIVAEPFDRARVERAFAELRARNEEQQGMLHAIATDAMARLPQASRQSLASWTQQPRVPARRLRDPSAGGSGATRP
jgi:hypothetical protein